MRKHYIRKVLAIVIALLLCSQYCCTAAEVEVVKSYYILKYEYEEFLTPVLKGGTTEKDLVAFFGDLEKVLRKKDNLTKENAEAYLKSALYTVATYPVSGHRTISAIISRLYGDEMAEYSETGIIPEKLHGVYDAVIRALFGENEVDKIELVQLYEDYLASVSGKLDRYTNASATKFNESMEATLIVLKNSEASQEDVAKAIEGLEEAYNNLKKKAETGGGSGGSGGSGGLVTGPVTDANAGDKNETGTVENTQQNSDETTSAFSDVGNDYWGYEAIKYLADLKVINGFEDGTFRPEELVTREQIAKMLCEAFELNFAEQYTAYSDLQPGLWCEIYVQQITASGIMKGMGDSVFGIGKTLTRQDLAVIAYRLIENGILENTFSESAEFVPFNDIAQAADYAHEAINKMKQYGIINGMGNNAFAPLGGVTRAQAAQIIYSLIK